MQKKFENKILVIMGTHPKSRDLFNWKRKDCDIWLFNEAPNLKKNDGKLIYPKANAVLQLHDEAIWKSPKNRSDEKHYEWLKKNKKVVVYMQKHYPDVPMSIQYPLKEILSIVKNLKMNVNGNEKIFKYFSSSLDFALALVAKMWKDGKRYKKVEIWGVELEMESEYEHQRTGFGFWVGYLTALGVEIVTFNKIFDIPMYGYEGDIAIPSKEIKKRLEDLKSELGNDKDFYSQEANEFLNNKLLELAKADVSESLNKEFSEITRKGEIAGILNGKIKESTRYLEKAQEMEKISGSSVFSIGEFDGSRVAYTKQLNKVTAEAIEVDKQIFPLLKRIIILKKGSQKRKRAIDELGKLLADLMNKNMLLFHIQGGIKENQYYLDSSKMSLKLAQKKN